MKHLPALCRLTVTRAAELGCSPQAGSTMQDLRGTMTAGLASETEDPPPGATPKSSNRSLQDAGVYALVRGRSDASGLSRTNPCYPIYSNPLTQHVPPLTGEIPCKLLPPYAGRRSSSA